MTTLHIFEMTTLHAFVKSLKKFEIKNSLVKTYVNELQTSLMK